MDPFNQAAENWRAATPPATESLGHFTRMPAVWEGEGVGGCGMDRQLLKKVLEDFLEEGAFDLGLAN